VTETAYHLVGAGGIGMSAIARLLLARGALVSGSDIARTPLVERSRGGDAVVDRPSGGEHRRCRGRRRVVGDRRRQSGTRCGARPPGSIVTRGQMLARLADGHRLVAVAGTHGKTTTTAMLASIFETAGLDPTVAVGGIRVGTETNARAGAGSWFVTESDESDGSFLHLNPTIAVVTNIENDHVSSDDELPKLLAQFAQFVAKVPPAGRAVIGIDNRASALVAKQTQAPVVTFGVRSAADLCAAPIAYEALGSRFTVSELGAPLGEVTLRVPGEINVSNALAAIGAARAAGVSFAPIVSALEAFGGVRRRFEIVGRGALTVIDDYAHHPTAIAATIAAARAFAAGAPVIAAFQPHRYTRTKYLKAEFAARSPPPTGCFSPRSTQRRRNRSAASRSARSASS
jgi:UDP-N-acetylmuramate--alanine ligase